MNHPFTCMVVGPTKAGKTVFVKQLIENKDRLINQDIDKVLWYYTESQPLYESLKNQVEFIEGSPDMNELKKKTGVNKLIILDDLMHETKGNAGLIKLFTRGCHHQAFFSASRRLFRGRAEIFFDDFCSAQKFQYTSIFNTR